mmetsp:Transcript_50939/g.99881  ORF Transcript_50939/g.99881 Transcript_50939/m.99881 type:complete len:275 (+) Transcript_50939:354-1178(+)
MPPAESGSAQKSRQGSCSVAEGQSSQAGEEEVGLNGLGLSGSGLASAMSDNFSPRTDRTDRSHTSQPHDDVDGHKSGWTTNATPRLKKNDEKKPQASKSEEKENPCWVLDKSLQVSASLPLLHNKRVRRKKKDKHQVFKREVRKIPLMGLMGMTVQDKRSLSPPRSGGGFGASAGVKRASRARAVNAEFYEQGNRGYTSVTNLRETPYSYGVGEGMYNQGTGSQPPFYIPQTSTYNQQEPEEGTGFAFNQVQDRTFTPPTQNQKFYGQKKLGEL